MKIRQTMACASVIAVLSLCVPSTPALAQDDYVRMNRTIELLENGQPALGVLSADYSLSNARTLAGSNLDFIIIDMEHFPFDVERLQMFLLGMTDKRRIQRGSRFGRGGWDHRIGTGERWSWLSSHTIGILWHLWHQGYSRSGATLLDRYR